MGTLDTNAMTQAPNAPAAPQPPPARFAVFDGDLDDYARWLDNSAVKPVVADAQTSTGVSAAPTAEDRKQRKREEAERRAKLAPLKAKVDDCERRLAKLATEAAQLDERLADAGLYAEGAKKQLLEVTAQRAKVTRETDTTEAQWLEASEALELAASSSGQAAGAD
jgi:ATP-binding cassette subfamily F protein 3